MHCCYCCLCLAWIPVHQLSWYPRRLLPSRRVIWVISIWCWLLLILHVFVNSVCDSEVSGVFTFWKFIVVVFKINCRIWWMFYWEELYMVFEVIISVLLSCAQTLLSKAKYILLYAKYFCISKQTKRITKQVHKWTFLELKWIV